MTTKRKTAKNKSKGKVKPTSRNAVAQPDSFDAEKLKISKFRDEVEAGMVDPEKTTGFVGRYKNLQDYLDESNILEGIDPLNEEINIETWVEYPSVEQLSLLAATIHRSGHPESDAAMAMRIWEASTVELRRHRRAHCQEIIEQADFRKHWEGYKVPDKSAFPVSLKYFLGAVTTKIQEKAQMERWKKFYGKNQVETAKDYTKDLPKLPKDAKGIVYLKTQHQYFKWAVAFNSWWKAHNSEAKKRN